MNRRHLLFALAAPSAAAAQGIDDSEYRAYVAGVAAMMAAAPEWLRELCGEAGRGKSAAVVQGGKLVPSDELQRIVGYAREAMQALGKCKGASWT